MTQDLAFSLNKKKGGKKRKERKKNPVKKILLGSSLGRVGGVNFKTLQSSFARRRAETPANTLY